MHKMSIAKGLFVCALTGLLASGCAPTVKTQTLAPAKAHEAAKLKRVAVLPFSGTLGPETAADVEASIVGIQIDGKPFFNVVERSQIDKVVREQHFQYGGYADENKAVQVGQIVGAEGIIMGTVSRVNVDDKPYREKRTKCAATNSDNKCVRWTEYEVSCTERTATFEFIPKVVKVETAQVVASENLSATAQAKGCSDASTPLKGRKELLASAQQQAVAKFAQLVAPHYVNLEIQLLTRDDSGMPESVKKMIDDGVTWASNGRLDRACDKWREASAAHPSGYAIPYLLGVCAETNGDLDASLAYYQKADKNTAKPVQEIADALGRVRGKIAGQAKLKEQMK